jgi:hypothetical protein
MACEVIGIVQRFIEAAVLEQGYRWADVAVFLGCHPSTRAVHCNGKMLTSRKSGLAMSFTSYAPLQLSKMQCHRFFLLGINP